jgi:hypothetical protein
MSMLLCIVTPIAIYMAADSRQYPNGSDTVQKVFIVGKDAILAHGGIGVIPFDDGSHGSWDAAVEMGRISSATPGGTFDKQMRFVQTQALKSFETAAKRYSGALTNNPHFTIMFAKRDSAGRAYFARQEFKVVSVSLNTGRWAHRVEPAPVQVIVNGEQNRTGIWWDVPPECRVSLTSMSFDLSPGHAFNSISGIIKDVAGQSAYCSQMIGGKVRAAISDNKETRWISE